VLWSFVASSLCAAEFPMPFNSGNDPHHTAPPIAAAAGASGLTLPPGFRASVFAAEPAVQNPIAMAWDGRGRLWIAENYTYAERGVKFETRLRDRVVVFEEGGAGGGFRTRRVFTDTVQRLTSVEVGHGGVWLMCPPQLLFVPDADGDAVPDGPPRLVLDGFTVPDANHHNFANGLRFGPDGWLYGRCGAASPGEVGVPGTPSGQRVPVRGTMWRYHPVRKVFEALGGGTTNPWGHDWDAHGELFFINTVNGHLWHGITGAHYARANTIDPNPRVYELIDQHADHWHFDTNRSWQQSRDGAANALGGGHAHVGMMIYQGENWPADYRGGLFTLNFHGRRANHERLSRRGSGYVGTHAPDVFLSPDPWFRGIEIGYGPDGGVFVLDWSDTGECHNSTGVNRTSGRIYKISHESAVASPEKIDLAQTPDRELARLQASKNEWLVRHARIELATRHAAGHSLTHAIEDLRTMFTERSEPTVQLRALWALHAIGATTPEFLRAQLQHINEHVRAWALRLLTDAWPLDSVLSRRPARPEIAQLEWVREWVTWAGKEPSALVRLALASTLQRLPPVERPALALALAARKEDARDHNLPLMIWYGLIPAADLVPDAVAAVALASELPATRRLIARRLAEDIEKRPAPLEAILAAAQTKSAEFRADVLDGMAQAFKGWRRARKPAGWDALAAAVVADAAESAIARVRDLNVLFGDGRALADVKALALDARADLAGRRAALESLIEARPEDLREVCERLLRVRFLNPAAARGLALFDDPAIGELIANAYGAFFHHSEQHVAIDVLASRPTFARALLEYVGAGKIPRHAITAFHARQIRGFNDPAIAKQLGEVWGESRESPGEKAAQIARLKETLSPASLAAANKSAGRMTYEQLCLACHKLHGEGSLIGPDLTGSNRDNLDYLLENFVDPSAVVTADFRIAIVTLKDGRVLNGFIAQRTPRTLTVRSMNDQHVVERSEVARIEESKQSLMPEGLIDGLTSEQQRDLIAYLMHPSQVAKPE